MRCRPAERPVNSLSVSLLAILVGLGCAACRAEPETGDEVAWEQAAPSGVPSDSLQTAVPGRPDSANGGTRADRPFRNFQLAPDPGQGTEVIVHPVRIENRSSETVTVGASAGAAPVLLDTLAPAESFRVNLAAPQGALRIEWRSLDDRWSGSIAVEPPAGTPDDSIAIVPIGPQSGPG